MAPGRNRERTAAGRRRHPGGTRPGRLLVLRDRKAKLPDQRLALLYLDVGRLLDAIAGARARAARADPNALRALSGVRPVAAAVTATPDSVGVESAVTTTGQRPLAQPAASGGALLAGAPSDAWLVLGSANVGAAAKRGLGRLAGLGAAGLSTEQLKARLRARTGLDLDRDLLDWAGDAALFVRGTSKRDVSGALVIRASDPSLARRSITKIAGAVRRFGHQPVRPETIEGAQGFSVAKPGAPRALVMLERGDEVVVAYGADSARAALAPSARLDSDPAFHSARGGARRRLLAQPLRRRGADPAARALLGSERLTRLPEGRPLPRRLPLPRRRRPPGGRNDPLAPRRGPALSAAPLVRDRRHRARRRAAAALSRDLGDDLGGLRELAAAVGHLHA